MLFPLFLSMFMGIFGRPCCHIYNKDIAYKIISIFFFFDFISSFFFSLIFFLFFDTFFSLQRLKEKSRLLPRKSISCESYFLYNFSMNFLL